jgi:putative spermidine/putrescine transport system permease protein
MVKISAAGQHSETSGRRIVFDGRPQLWWLAVPAVAVIALLLFVPFTTLIGMSFGKSLTGSLALANEFTWENYQRVFTRAIYADSIWRSIGLAAVATLIALILAYPLAYLMAKTRHPRLNSLLMLLVLSAMQLDMVVRIYGLMVLLGDNGLINATLIEWGVISEPLPLMYNMLGIVVGLVQVGIPFMVLSLTSSIKSVDQSLEMAARSLGATPWQTFGKVVLPLTIPGILAGSMLVFALSLSSYAVPTLMGGFKVMTLPIHIYQQIAESARFQFGAALAVVLFLVSIGAVFIFQRANKAGLKGWG